ncbi:MAG: rhomboid family intramembrane serine protease [Leptospiraceae bacterium]|nr:rhomboid family intramembrane serine protease [Leptospiraceae bacterium]
MGIFKAPVTRTLVGINVVIYILMQLYLNTNGAVTIQEFFQVYALVPYRFWEEAAIWQPLTSMFLHGGLLHILFNMVTLWSLGQVVEHKVGGLKFTALYFISGFFSAALILIADRIVGENPHLPTVGASGAIFGLVAALMIFYPNARVLLFFVFPMKVRTLAIGVIAISIVLQIMQWTGEINLPISHLGHIGGFFGGLLFTWLALAPSQEERMDPGPAMGRGGFSFSGGARTGTSSSTRPEEQILRMMQEIMRQREQGGRFQQGQGGGIKEINPLDDKGQYEGPSGSSAGQSRPEPRPGDETEGGKLYYDPATGKFYFR